MAYHDSIKCFRLIIERMNNWNPHAYDEALMYHPGTKLVSPFWQLTSKIVLAWGAQRIRKWMQSMLLYQPGTYGFTKGPVTARQLRVQSRYQVSLDNAAPFLDMQEACVIANRAKNCKGFGNLILSPHGDYLPWHWN